jgi:dipeptidyl-peptidase-4
MRGGDYRIADGCIAHFPDNGAQVAHLSCLEGLAGYHLGAEIAHFVYLECFAVGFHDDLIADGYLPRKNADVRDNPAVRVISRIENKAAQSSVFITRWRGNSFDDRFQQFLNFGSLVDGCAPSVEFLPDGSGVAFPDPDPTAHVSVHVDALSGARTTVPVGAGGAAGAASATSRDPQAGAAMHATPTTFKREAYMIGLVDAAEVASPDHRWFALLRDGNLWLRSTADGRAIALTNDGTADVSWDLESGARNPWSPDGLRLFAIKFDRSKVFKTPSLHYSKRSDEVSYTRFQQAGGALDRAELYLVPVLGKPPLRIDVGDTTDQYFRLLGWRPDGSEVLIARLTRDYARIDVLAVHALTGVVRTVLTETSPTFVRLQHEVLWSGDAGFTMLPDGHRFLWKSERDGWNHLYLYDLAGKLERQLTRGHSPVHEIARVDAPGGWVYYTASEEGRPYDVHLYRVALRGGEATRLTAGEGRHSVRFAPSGAFFVDTYSSVRSAPRSELRRADGTRIAVLFEADIRRLRALGWVPPEEFTVKAADGVTDLAGVLYRPDDLDPGRRYPLIEYIYGGPQVANLPTTFCGDGPVSLGPHEVNFAQALAKTGYVVVMIAGRGTPGRSKAFQDAVYHEWADHVVADHAGAIRQLLAARPYLDSTRVGIYGRSWGGYYTFRLLADRPDVYRAGVSISPGYDPYNGILYEPYLGLPDVNRDPYEAASPFRLAKNVKGDLMLMGGTSDYATYGDVMRMVGALVEAKVHHELVLLPDQPHGFSGPAAEFADSEIRRFFDTHFGTVPAPAR